MSVGNFTPYREARVRILKGEFPIGHIFKAILLAAAYTPDANGDVNLADIVANEIADVGYTRQQVTMTVTLGVDDKALLDCGDVSFGSNVTITAKYMAVYDDTHANDGLIGYVDLKTEGGSVSSTNSEFTVRTPNGLLKL